MKIKKLPLLITFILLCEAAGIIGAFFTINAIPTWYAALNKPSFNPPPSIFGPTWTVLYLLMGISLYLVWLKKGAVKLADWGVKVFLVHLLLNFLWTPVFFGLKNISLALVIILMIWGLIIYMIYLFWKIDKKAAYLLLPYLAWVSFASILNFSIMLLN